MSIIKTNMAKAKEILKAKIRIARESKLAELDIEFCSAVVRQKISKTMKK